MRILILYDSYFDNTKKIAEIISEVLSVENNVTLEKISTNSIFKPEEYDLVVIGSPTRGFTCTKNILDYVKSLPDDSSDLSFVIFDTNIHIEKVNNKFFSFLVKRFGYSNDTLSKILKKKKANIIGIEKFYVADSQGPLEIGEEKRAIEFSNYILKEFTGKQ